MVSEDQHQVDTHDPVVLGDHHGADTHKDGVPGDHGCPDTHTVRAPGGQDSVVTQDNAVPGDQLRGDTHRVVVPGDHHGAGTHKVGVPGDHNGDDTHVRFVPGDQGCHDTHAEDVPGDRASTVTQSSGVPGGHYGFDPQTANVSGDYDLLLVLADTVQDLEDARKAAENRVRSLTHETVEGERGGFFGKAFSPEHDVVVALQRIADGLREVEGTAVHNLERAVKRHPLYAWVERHRGVGLKTAGRLLGLLGDPAWHAREDRPRTVGELFAFAGVAGPGQRRVRGQKLTYDPRIKPKLHVIVDGLVKAGVRHGEPVTPWGELYYDRKAFYAAQRACEVCRKSQRGSATQVSVAHCTPAHVDAKARRVLMREFLRTLWAAARTVHGWDERDPRTELLSV